MSKPVTINGHRVKTEKAEPPLPHFSPTKFYATIEGRDDVVGNGSSRHMAIEHLRTQLEAEQEALTP